jgi:hypothetical protein
MNEEQTKIVERAIERTNRAIDGLEREQPQNAAAEIESYRGELQMLQNEKFMDGLFESLEAVRRGEKGTPGSALKRKYKRA